MPTFELEFTSSAWEEWQDLDNSARALLKKRLAERLEAPHVISARLRGSENRYKIKLRKIGYRLVYEVNDTAVTVLVIAVGRRDAVYDLL